MNNLTLRIILQFITDQFNNAMNGVRGQLGGLNNSAQNSDAVMGQFQQRVNRTVSSLLDFGGAIRNLITGFSLLAIAVSVKELIAFADNLRLIEGRIKNASDGVIDFVRSYAQLVAISFKTGTSFAENASMFARLNAGMREMGGTSQDTLRQVDLLAKAMRVSNTAQSESASVIRQWSQAIVSGLLRGDEFNSMMENAPRIAQALADGLHVNIGVLRTMAEAGQLTATKVSQALASQGAAIDKEFSRLPLTIGVTFEKIKTAFGQYVAEADKGKGATAGIAASFDAIAQNLPALLDSLVTLGKVVGVIFAGSAITGVARFTAGIQAQISAGRLAATVTAAQSEALVMNAQRTVAATAANVANVQSEIAATQARLAGTLSMGERMAVTNTLNLQTQSLTTATAAQTAAQVALAEVQAATNAGFWASVTAMTAAQGAMAALNGVMILFIAKAVGDWLNGFSVVREGAAYTIHAIKSLFDDLIYTVKKFGLSLDLAFTFNESKQQQLKQAIKELDTEFIANAQAQREALDASNETGNATAKQATETEKLVDSFRHIKTPQQTFIEKSAELTREFNKGKVTLKEYTEILLGLQNAMRADVTRQQSPFAKEQSKLQGEVDKATLSPEEFQRKQYLKEYSAAETDVLMESWLKTQAYQKQIAQSEKNHAKDSQALAKEVLSEQLNVLKDKESAVKTAADLEQTRLKTDFEKQKLALDEQLAKELITQQQFKDQELALQKQLDKDIIESKRAGLLQSLALEKENLALQREAVKSDPIKISASNSLGSLIAGGESAGNAYNAYNRGTKGNVILPSNGDRNLEAMTLAEIQAKQALSISDNDRLGAVGKYQIIATTLKAAIEALKLSADTKFDAATQEKIFAQYLVANKQPAVKNYITGKSNDINAAQMAMSAEFASVARPDTGKSYYDGKGGNKASIPTSEIQNSLKNARSTYGDNTSMGMDKASAYSDAVANTGGSIDDKQAKLLKLKALHEQEIALEAEYKAKLKALGYEAQNNETVQAEKELSNEKDQLAKQKQLKSEALQEENAAALDAIATKEAQSQQELDLDNISQEQHLANLRQFADERYAIELELLNKKRALLGQDELALAKNLHDQEALWRNYQAKVQGINHQKEKSKKEDFKAEFAPLQSALNQAVNGVLTGQQTIKNAVKNAGQSILITYANTWAQKRLLDVAQFAWEKTKFVAHWLWEESGFISKETRKMLTKAFSEIFQTETVAVGVSSRETIEDAANAKSSVKMAWQAAKGAFTSVMGSVPFPFNMVLAPIAGAAAFVGVMAMGSAKRGNLRVEEDGQLFELHKNETVLPESSANAFRTVTDIVKNHVFKPETQLDPIATIDKMISAGTLKGGWTVPASALNISEQSQKSANGFARDHIKTLQTSKNTELDGAQAAAVDGATHVHFHGTVIGEKELFQRNYKHIVDLSNKQVRNFKVGKKQ